MQWWRIEEDGTYTIALLGWDAYSDKLDLTLYAESDLSTPVPQYENETNTITLDGIEIEAEQRTLRLPQSRYLGRWAVHRDFPDGCLELFGIGRRQGSAQVEKLSDLGFWIGLDRRPDGGKLRRTRPHQHG